MRFRPYSHYHAHDCGQEEATCLPLQAIVQALTPSDGLVLIELIYHETGEVSRPRGADCRVGGELMVRRARRPERNRIAVTRVTALLARRVLYCATANTCAGCIQDSRRVPGL